MRFQAKKYLMIIAMLGVMISPVFTAQLVNDGTFEQTSDINFNPLWTSGLRPTYTYPNYTGNIYPDKAITGNWSAMAAYLNQTITIPVSLIGQPLYMHFRFNMSAVQSGNTQNIEINMLDNATQSSVMAVTSETCIYITTPNACGGTLYNSGAFLNNASTYYINTATKDIEIDFTIPDGYQFMEFKSRLINVGGSWTDTKFKMDDLGIYAGNLSGASVSNNGNTYLFSVKSQPDTSVGFSLYANLTCSVSGQQLANEPMLYDAFSGRWTLSKSLPGCSGSYNATYFGTRYGYDTTTLSAIRANATIGYRWNFSSYTFTGGSIIGMNLTFYDTYSGADITSIISKNIDNSLQASLSNIIDPTLVNRPVAFYYNSGDNRYQANFSVPYISCGAMTCVWLSHYFPNITGITASGYQALDITPAVNIVSANDFTILSYPSLDTSGLHFYNNNSNNQMSWIPLNLNVYPEFTIKTPVGILNSNTQLTCPVYGRFNRNNAVSNYVVWLDIKPNTSACTYTYLGDTQTSQPLDLFSAVASCLTTTSTWGSPWAPGARCGIDSFGLGTKLINQAMGQNTFVTPTLVPYPSSSGKIFISGTTISCSTPTQIQTIIEVLDLNSCGSNATNMLGTIPAYFIYKNITIGLDPDTGLPCDAETNATCLDLATNHSAPTGDGSANEGTNGSSLGDRDIYCTANPDAPECVTAPVSGDWIAFLTSNEMLGVYVLVGTTVIGFAMMGGIGAAAGGIIGVFAVVHFGLLPIWLFILVIVAVSALGANAIREIVTG